jgi:transposase
METESNFLSQAERDFLTARHRRERDKRICDRIKAVLLLDKGWPCDKIAAVLLLDVDTVKRCRKLYLDGGKEALFTLNYLGKPCALNDEQVYCLKNYVKETNPKSALEVVSFIKLHFDIQYTQSGAVALLHRLGFIYKKPKLIPGKANKEQQERFLEELQELESELQPSDEILYMDGVHPQHNSKPAYGWFEKGVDIHLKANSGRQRININGALNRDSLDVTIHAADSVNAQSTIELFKKLEMQYRQAKRIVIVCDNASYYKSKLVSEYLKESKIELKFLPPYSPNLNLIERLWGFMNRKIRDNKYFEKFGEFKDTILNFFQKLSTYKEELKRLFSKKFHIIKT